MFEIILREHLRFIDSIFFHVIDIDCLARHEWLYQVYLYYQEGQISTGELYTAIKCVLDNLCLANV